MFNLCRKQPTFAKTHFLRLSFFKDTEAMHNTVLAKSLGQKC